jgi:hypothetical protein
MLLTALLSALALGASDPSPLELPQETSRLPDLEVVGRPTPEAVRDFVGRIAAPATRRGLARWEGPLCPGVVNLGPEPAQAVIDRIALAAADVGVEVGRPGCNPNVVVLFTDDGAGLAASMVRRDRRVFDLGVGGLNRGDRALEAFTDAPGAVRWWAMSMPFDTETGQLAVRMPGREAGGPVASDLARRIGCDPMDCVLTAAPIIVSDSASRLNTQVADALFKVIIVVDIDEVGDVNAAQLGDYLAFISLAQIDAAADTGRFDTVLNLFSGGGAEGLTEWDRSYLQALYATRPQRRTVTAAADAVAAIMTRDRLEARRSE